MLKKSEVKIGGLYIAKITNRLVPVRIDAESRYGGWDAMNVRTKKSVRIKSAQRLRREATQSDLATIGDKNTKCDKNANTPIETPTMPKAAPTVKPEVKPGTATGICPNCGGTEVDEDGDCVKCHEPKVGGKTSETGKATQPQPPKGKSAKPKRPSGLDAAAKILEETGVPMNVKEITEVAFAKGYWKPAGRTPSATLAAALIREIAKKGEQSRFRKCERGKFVRA